MTNHKDDETAIEREKSTNASEFGEHSKAAAESHNRVTAGLPQSLSTTPDLPPSWGKELRRSSFDEGQNSMTAPLFMTSLENPNEEQSALLDAMWALSHEGPPSEVAGGFREQGNEHAKAKRWKDAQEFYNKAIAALRGVDIDEAELKRVENDVAEKNKEREIGEACYINRALCHLQLKNYRSCVNDCATALRYNPSNIKAHYRAALALFSLSKYTEALDACDRGLALRPNEPSIVPLRVRILAAQSEARLREAARQEEEDRRAAAANSLTRAFWDRGIRTRKTKDRPDLEDAAPSLDENGVLGLPVLWLYPLEGQSDFVKRVAEDETLAVHLEYLLPPPWDHTRDYGVKVTACYVEKAWENGECKGLLKVGKSVPLKKVLSDGKVDVVDGLLRVYIVPKGKAAAWVEDWKMRNGKTSQE